jgi:ABC-2 type transport system ATP-binding protein
MSIEVNSVTKIYGKQKALDNISFSIPTGQIVGFLGPNGAGKSTMMKIITSYIPQNEGEVVVFGKNNLSEDLDLKKHIGYLPEHNPLYTEMYVKEYLRFVAQMYGVSTKKVDEVIELTGLTPEYRKKISSLSKGYRQRVGLAQALIHDPEVLILDEPTTGLDPNQLVEIRELIKNIGKTKTVLLSTHIMQEVEAICERVIIINKGKLVADAPTKELKSLQTNVNVLSVGLNKSVEKLYFASLKGVKDIKVDIDNRWKIYFDASKDIRKDLFNLVQSNGDYITHLDLKEQNLEEVFHQLTQN